MILGMIGSGRSQLQSTIAVASATGSQSPFPHHPCTCSGGLWYNEDGSFGCDHVKMPPDDPRTQACVNHSIALLLLELASEL